MAAFFGASFVSPRLSGLLHHPIGYRMVTYDTSTAGSVLNHGWKEDHRQGLLDSSSPIKPSHSGLLDTCYIKCMESQAIQATLPTNQSTQVPNGEFNRACCSPDIPTLLLPTPAMLARSGSHCHGDTRPSRAAKFSDVRAANAALLRTCLSPLF